MYYYIVNPAANHGAIDSIQERLKTTLLRLDIDGEFAKTIGPGDAAKIAQTAIDKGVKTIVAVGGDATVNEIVTAVQKADKPVAIGIIPIGKSNTLASHLQIKDWQQACKVLAARRLQSYSLMQLGTRVFIYSAEMVPTQPKSQPNAARTDFKYLLDIDSKFRVRGASAAIKIYNQKFLHPSLDNQLVVHIYPAAAPAKPGLVRSLLKRWRKPAPESAAFSQLHCSRLAIQARTSAAMLIDGAPVEGKEWEIKLSQKQLQLITNRMLNDKL